MSINARRVERPARAHYEAGELIGGKYRLARMIGEGSMGSVWVATNVALDSKVAIKLLNPDLRSASSLTRFLREARSSAMLDHPGIVRVYDLGAGDGGEPFIVMELLSGESLGTQLTRVKTLSAIAAVQLILPIAAAIDMAHQHGVVHRDLKPDNIMLAEIYGGRVQPKVVDFGVAKLKWNSPSSSSKSTTGMTVIGTPDYMSPEQATGMGVVDHRADIWSLCVVLYEMLSGQAPFSREQVWGTLHAVVEEPAPVLATENPVAAAAAGRPHVDPALWAILERGLQKSPENRWQSMRALGEALASWLSSQGVHEDACGTSLSVNWLATPHSTAPIAASISPSATTFDGAAQTLRQTAQHFTTRSSRRWLGPAIAVASTVAVLAVTMVGLRSNLGRRDAAAAAPQAIEHAPTDRADRAETATPTARAADAPAATNPAAPPSATPIAAPQPAASVGLDAGAPSSTAHPSHWTGRAAAVVVPAHATPTRPASTVAPVAAPVTDAAPRPAASAARPATDAKPASGSSDAGPPVEVIGFPDL